MEGESEESKMGVESVERGCGRGESWGSSGGEG